MIEIIDAVETVVRTIRTRKLQGARLNVLSDSSVVQLTLDYYLTDFYSDTLNETGVYVIKVIGRSVQEYCILGVDGSSRRFSTPYGSLVLATVSLAYGPLPLLDYPPLGYEYPIRCELTQPFIATYEALGVQHKLIATKSSAGHSYESPPPLSGLERGSRGYTLAEIAHEIRTRLETLSLEIAMQKTEKRDLILLDGPLYQRPWTRELQRNPYLKEDWKELTKERVEVLEKSAWSSVAVVGSVKRLDKSRLLVSVHEELKRHLGLNFPQQDNDQAEAIQLIYHYVKNHNFSGSEPLLIGPFSMSPSERIRNEAGCAVPEIIYSYVVVPSLPYTGNLDGACGVLRLEVLKEVYDREGLDVFFRALSEGIMQGLPLPPAQAFADARCRQTSRVLFEYLCGAALKEGVELTYDTWREYSHAGEEYAE